MSQLPPELQGFAQQGRIVHTATVAGGIGCFALVYLAIIGLLSGSLTIAGEAGTVATGIRRIASMIGAVACWGYFAVATTIGRGGPVLNMVFYPVGILAGVPVLIAWVVSGPIDGYPLSTAERIATMQFASDAVTIVLPGIAIAGLLLAGWWYSWLDPSDRRRWIDRHLPGAFRAKFIDPWNK